MAIQLVNLGSTANDGTGDNLRVGGQKINSNFIELEKTRRIVKAGEVQVFKAAGNTSIDSVEPGDVVLGWLSTTLFSLGSLYVSGDETTEAAYDPNNSNILDTAQSED